MRDLFSQECLRTFRFLEECLPHQIAFLAVMPKVGLQRLGRGLCIQFGEGSRGVWYG